MSSFHTNLEQTVYQFLNFVIVRMGSYCVYANHSISISFFLSSPSGTEEIKRKLPVVLDVTHLSQPRHNVARAEYEIIYTL